MDPPVPRLKKQSKLLCLSIYEQNDELEEKLESGYNLVQNRTNGLSEKESSNALLQMAIDQKLFEVITGGLLYGLLTEPQNGHKFFSEMALIANDGWFCALCNMNMVLIEIYPRTRPEVREQIVFFFREAIRSNVPKIDNVLINLLRNANDGGDLKETCNLLGAVAGVMNENHSWLSGLKPKASLIPVALLIFSRFICDLNGFAPFEPLRQQMITICHWLLTERFMDCAQLGRDLLLILMRISKVSQFATIWKQLLHSPNKQFGISVDELMTRPCPHTLPVLRITMTMQRKVDFILKMKPGGHERHIEWFKKHYLSNPDAGNIRAELIRYVVLLPFAEPVPQFTQDMKAIFIASMLSQINAITDIQLCKLHLIWDWLCYDPSTTSYMQLEPFYHVFRHVLHTQPILANSLIDFLIRMSAELYPPLQNRIVASVVSAFKALVDHNVMPSLSVISDNPILQKNVRESFRETFKGLFRSVQPPPVQLHPPAPPNTDKPDIIILDPEYETKNAQNDGNAQSADETVSTAVPDYEAEDSGDSDEYGTTSEEKIMALLPAFKEEFREAIESLATSKSNDNETRCELMQRLMICVYENEELLDEEQIELVTECLLLLIGKEIRQRKLLPEGFTESPEIIQEMFNQPLYVMFKYLCSTPENDAAREPLLSLIAEMCEKCVSISYLLLFYIAANRREQNDTYISAYTDLCRLLDRTPIKQIVVDLEQCHMDDYVLFAYLIPYVYDKYANEAKGSAELIKLLAHSLDAKQIADLVGETIRENISLFRKDSFLSILNASLSWETTSQFIFWQLVHAESVPTEWVYQIIPRLQYPKHTEAITQIYIMLQRLDREPNMNLIRNLLSRPSNDMFTVNCLKILIKDPDYAARVAELLASLMDKLIQSGDLLPIHCKQKRPAQRYVCLDQLFSHLDKFRQSCLSKDSHTAEMFLSRQTLQESFTNARTTEAISSLRIRYSELFAVMEILSDDTTQSARSLRRTKVTKRTNDTSDDETRVRRKRQKFIVDSDSE